MASGGFDDFLSDEHISNNCCICAKKNRRREAEKYCLQCKVYYCTGCVDVHTFVPDLEKHTLLGKSDFKTSKVQDVSTLPSYPTQRCEQHKSEVLNMYCKQHDEVCCATCIAEHHRNCSDIQSVSAVSENIDKLYNEDNTSSMKTAINEETRRLQNLKEDLQTQVKELKEVYEINVTVIQWYKSELQTLIDSMEQETTREITEAFKRFETSLTDNIQSIEKLMHSLNEFGSELEKTKGKRNKAQEFVTLKSFEKLTVKFHEKERTIKNRPPETLFFDANDNVKHILSGYKTLGKVSVSRHPVQNKSVCTVKSKREISVKDANDRNDCRIAGSCVIDDVHLLLSDEANQSIKRFNMCTEKVVDYIKIPASPEGVCPVSSKEAAVCLSNRTVQFVSLGPSMTLTRKIKFFHPCYGICVHQGSVFITDQDKSLYIYDLGGQFHRKVDFDETGQNIFDFNQHISVTDSGKLYVADFDMGIAVFETDGKYLSTIRVKQVRGYQGVCTDGVNLFVCGWNSDNVGCLLLDTHRLTALGQVKRPFSVSFDRISRRLYCTGSTLTVFELE